MMKKLLRNGLIITFSFFLVIHETFAGPPFLTDDPQPVEYHHFEFYLFSMLNKTTDQTQIQSPAIEMNYGAIPNLQLHLVVPYLHQSSQGTTSTSGLGDTEAGVKYRFVEETNCRPQIGVFPLAEFPTGNSNRNLGNGRTWIKLPIWLQKSWGPWTTYGGGGYGFNSAPGKRNFPYAGWLLQRDLNEQFTLGAEFFSQGADSVDSHGSTIFNAGGYYNFNKSVSLLFSAGHSIGGQLTSVAYLGLLVQC